MAWLVVVIGLTVASGMLAGEAGDDYSLPGSESQEALELLADAGFSVS